MEIHTKFLKKKNGFFVEYRSSPDGFASKTLYLEKHENWTGKKPYKKISLFANVLIKEYV
jgi:hypothetical protein